MLHGRGLEPPRTDTSPPRRRIAPTTPSPFPAIAGNKTQPRPDQAWRIRALGPRFHAAAEAQLTAWQTWVTTNKKTWIDAGREFRKRMAAAGYDVPRSATCGR